jgi:hypothetical protein
MNFGDIGQNTLRESVSFKKIHKMSKTYNSNLFLAGVTQLNSLSYLYDQTTPEVDFFKSQTFNFAREHNLLTSKSNSTQQNLFLDKTSFEKFLTFNDLTAVRKKNSLPFTFSLFTERKNYASTEVHFNETFKRLNLATFLNQKEFFSAYKDLLLNTETALSRKQLNSSLFSVKPFSPSIFKLKNTENTLGLNLSSVFFLNQELNADTANVFVKNSSDNNFSATNLSPKYYRNLNPQQSSLNFKQTSSVYNKQENQHDSVYELYNSVKGHGNLNFYHASLNKPFFEAPYSPVMSSNPALGNAMYDDSSIKYQSTSLLNNVHTLTVDSTSSESVFLLTGKKDGLPKFLTTAY